MLPAGTEMVMPGDTVTVTVKLIAQLPGGKQSLLFEKVARRLAQAQ